MGGLKRGTIPRLGLKEEKPMTEAIWLSQDDVKSLAITMKEVMEGVEKGWRLKGEGKVELPAKPGVHPRKDCYIHAMPCWISGEIDAAGLKWVAGYPENPKRGLPYNTGLFILNDCETGLVKAVMDANWITTWRTGAASGVGALHLAPKGASVLALIGLGTQGRINLRAMVEALPDLKEVRLHDAYEGQFAPFLAEMKPLFPHLNYVTCPTVEAVCDGADVVITCTPILAEPKRIVRSAWLKKEVLCIAVDYDSAFDSDVMTDGEGFVCDDRNQYLWTQSHGIYFQQGYPEENQIYADMGEIIAGHRAPLSKGRRAALFMGIASHDVMTAGLIYARALERGVGQRLPL